MQTETRIIVRHCFRGAVYLYIEVEALADCVQSANSVCLCGDGCRCSWGWHQGNIRPAEKRNEKEG